MFNSEASLAEYIGQSSFGQSLVLRHNCTKIPFGRSFFQRNVAALLPQFDESSALEGANEALSGNTRQLRHLPGDFDNRPEGLLLGEVILGSAPGFEVKLNRFTEIRPCGLDVFPLRSHIEFRAASHIQVGLFCDQGGKAVGHI
ncbi:MAG: hypothetical protein JWN92_1001 [Candidatus Acidoferrum typicum]|nr:hypothetical protein [Candidatus Acidoferrum typicum]